MRSAAIAANAAVHQVKARDNELRAKLERAEADDGEASSKRQRAEQETWNRRQRARCTNQLSGACQSPTEDRENDEGGDGSIDANQEDYERPQAQIESVLLQGEFANKFIRVGEDYQAVIPLVRSPSPQREDELVHVEYEPLIEPPKPIPILTLKQVRAAEAAAAAAAAAAEEDSSDDDELDDFDEDGEPLLPDGVVVSGLCLASGTIAGERRMFKATLLSVRRFRPHLLVKYLGDEMGQNGPFSMPDSLRSYLTRRDVTAWIPPEDRPESTKQEVRVREHRNTTPIRRMHPAVTSHPL